MSASQSASTFIALPAAVTMMTGLPVAITVFTSLRCALLRRKRMSSPPSLGDMYAKGEGVLHVVKQEPQESEHRRTFSYEKKDNKIKFVNVSLINSPNLEDYDLVTTPTPRTETNSSGFELIENTLKNDYQAPKPIKKNDKNKIGNVTAMAISPSNDNIALYVSDCCTIFYFSSQISKKVSNKIDKYKFEIDPNIDIKDQQTILNFKTEQQLLFCGEKTLAIVGGKYIMMINTKNETIPPILVDETDYNEIRGHIYCKGISEIDGIRYITDNEVHLIRPVPNELNEICNPFSGSISKELVNSYGNFLSKNPLCNEECSLNVFKKVSSGENDMLIFTKCLSQVIEYESKIDNDYNTFAKRKIYSIPDLFINGVPYRGSWFSKYVFRSICNGFLDDEKICEGINPRDIISARASGNTILFFIIFITILVTCCSLLCYKKYINKNLEDAINERIQEQALKSISQYQMFKDTKNQSTSLELVNE